MPTMFPYSEGNMGHGDNRKSCTNPARSETLRMSGSNLHRSWEVSTAPEQLIGRGGKGASHNAAINAVEKSDTPIVPKKPPNKGQAAEAVEGRGVAKGNAQQSPTRPTQSGESVLTGLARIREAASGFALTTRGRSLVR